MVIAEIRAIGRDPSLASATWDELPTALENLDTVWDTLSLQEQCWLLKSLLVRVSYDSRQARVSITFREAAVKRAQLKSQVYEENITCQA